MSPSRRRAIGAVRGFASRPRRRAPSRAPWYGPVAVGRDVPIAPPRLVAVPPRPCPVVRSRRGRARCPHRAAAPRRGARLSIPSPPPRSVALVLENAKNLCVPIHPAPSLFVFLCDKNTHPLALSRHRRRPWGLPTPWRLATRRVPPPPRPAPVFGIENHSSVIESLCFPFYRHEICNMRITILLSVIVPTRNEERNLDACLRCFDKAKENGWCETIVVDNASADATPDIARKAGARLFEQAPERSAQRNRGAQEANGRFLLFLDADMRVPPETVDELYRRLTEESSADAWYIPEIRVGSGFWIRVRNFERSFYNATCIDALRVFRTDVFRSVGGYDVSITGFEDWDLDKRMLAVPFRTSILSNALLHDEGAFSLRRHLNKKIHYSHWTNRYREKWGADDPILKKQFGFRYRFFGVFCENGKWKRLLRHPILFSGILFDRFLVGMTWLLNRR